MAAQKTFVVEDASFAAVDIPGVTAMDYADGGSVQNFFADGDVYSQFAWMENIVPTASVTTSDFSLVANAAFDPGDVGALVLTYGQRAAGSGGITAGASLIVTWNSSTMLGQVAPSAQQQGVGSWVLPFTGVSADGTTNPITTTAIG